MAPLQYCTDQQPTVSLSVGPDVATYLWMGVPDPAGDPATTRLSLSRMPPLEQSSLCVCVTRQLTEEAVPAV